LSPKLQLPIDSCLTIINEHHIIRKEVMQGCLRKKIHIYPEMRKLKKKTHHIWGKCLGNNRHSGNSQKTTGPVHAEYCFLGQMKLSASTQIFVLITNRPKEIDGHANLRYLCFC
jgi:hypothetical protein